MSGIKIFEAEAFGQVRVVDVDGEPWFVARDVCECLELGNPRTSIALLDEDEKGVHTMDTPGGQQEMSIVSEAGLYSLILRSRKTRGQGFQTLDHARGPAQHPQDRRLWTVESPPRPEILPRRPAHDCRHRRGKAARP